MNFTADVKIITMFLTIEISIPHLGTAVIERLFSCDVCDGSAKVSRLEQ